MAYAKFKSVPVSQLLMRKPTHLGSNGPIVMAAKNVLLIVH